MFLEGNRLGYWEEMLPFFKKCISMLVQGFKKNLVHVLLLFKKFEYISKN